MTQLFKTRQELASDVNVSYRTLQRRLSEGTKTGQLAITSRKLLTPHEQALICEFLQRGGGAIRHQYPLNKASNMVWHKMA
jgi:transcriptional antiterminator